MREVYIYVKYCCTLKAPIQYKQILHIKIDFIFIIPLALE